MKKSITRIMAAFALLVTLAIPMGVWGQTRTEITWSASQQGYENQQTIESVTFDSNVSAAFNKGTNNNPPKYYTSGTAIRCYGGNYFIISTTSGNLTSIVITFGSSDGSNEITTDVGTYLNGNWTGSATSVKFTIGGTSGNRRIAGFTINYSTGDNPNAFTPTFSPVGGTYAQPQTVTISSATEGATIYYTTNGDDPTTSSSVYRVPLTISETTTIKAMATATGYSNSSVASATYTITTPSTITAVRAQGTGSVFTQGVVTSCVGTTGYIQDDDAAICVYGSSLTVGNEITVSGTLNNYNGLLEITNPQVTVISSGNTINPELMTIAQAVASTNQGWYIRIEDATVTAISDKNVTIAQGDDNVVVRFANNSDITFEVDDIISLNGNIGAYNGVQIANPQNVTVQEDANPSILAENVSIASDATNGSIAYTINNPATNGTMAAATASDWLTLDTDFDSPIAFTCTANTATTARTATIVLTYTYNTNQTVTKEVTVTQAAYEVPHVTWDLSIASYASASEDQVTWTSDYAAMVVDKANASTNANNYLGGNQNSTRFYKNSKLTLSPAAGYAITSVVFTATTTGYASALQNSTWTNATASVDGTTVTVTPTDGANNIVAVIGGTCGFTSVTVYYEESIAPVVPSITITPDNFELDANSHMGEVLAPITYQNIVIVSGSGTESFDVQYYDAEGQEIEQTWCSVGAAAQGETGFNLIIAAGVNEGNEARTAYFKLYGLDEDANLVYSNLVTVTQAAPVIDYAVLPFVWAGGERSAFEALNGTSTHNVGDYGENQGVYRMKLDDDGDYIQVKCDQQPGKVTIGVKMIGGGNTSTITIQGSADGETFTDIEELEISGAQNDELTLETTTVFAENDRYVRMLFTKGSNVGVGPITIEKGSAPSIVVTPATLDLEATGTGQNGVQMQQFVVTYHNMDIEDNSDFAIQFYDAEGEEQEQPTWITPNPAFVAGGNEEGYMVMLFIEGNTDVARSAYFKVYALGEEDYIYSNLVTINQAGAPQQYTLTVEPFENLDLITFVNDEMVLEGDGEITVTEGDEIMLSVVALEGYEMETLMVNGVNHVNDIADDFTYSFEMPAENVTISATAVEDVAPAPSNYVRITALDQLTDGSKVIIAARHNATVDSYYAMKNATSNKPEGTMFTSMTSGDDEVVASTITDDEDNYYWTVNVTENGYTFTNAAGALIGYSSGTNFYTGGDNTEWTIERSTAGDGTMVPGYAGFVIKNSNTNTRAFAFNGTAFGAYATTNMNAGGYNFFLDFFVETEPVTVTYTLEIAGYEAGSDGGYYLIASPVTVNPANVEGMTAGEYDLYSFDQAEAEEWRNYKVNAFNLEPGKGYLYAKQATEPDEVFHFELTGTPYNGEPITLSKSENVDFPGWNLVGNPFGQTAYIDRDFYVMKSDGSEIIPGEGNEIAPMQGFFVIAANDGEELTFSNEAPTNTGSKIVINVSNARRSVIDRAMVRFGEGRTLPKFMLNDENTKIYIAEGNEEYAVVRSINECTTPVSFHAAENGTYTLSVSTENVDFTFFHLIDNMTGNDIDLLSTPNYTFEASTTDYAQRFSLLYATIDGVDENNGEAFAFFNGNEWVVNNEGEATLQVVDVMGRLISSETVNGTATVNLNQSAGIYMLRLVNGNNVKVQKVVVR